MDIVCVCIGVIFVKIGVVVCGDMVFRIIIVILIFILFMRFVVFVGFMFL